MSDVEEGFVDRVMMSALGALDGRRLRLVRPDGFSLPMGDPEKFDFEEWSLRRFEAALEAYARSPKVRQAATALARSTYWDAVPMEANGRYSALLGRSLASLRRALAKECAAHPMPVGALER